MFVALLELLSPSITLLWLLFHSENKSPCVSSECDPLTLGQKRRKLRLPMRLLTATESSAVRARDYNRITRRRLANLSLPATSPYVLLCLPFVNSSCWDDNCRTHCCHSHDSGNVVPSCNVPVCAGICRRSYLRPMLITIGLKRHSEIVNYDSVPMSSYSSFPSSSVRPSRLIQLGSKKNVPNDLAPA